LTIALKGIVCMARTRKAINCVTSPTALLYRTARWLRMRKVQLQKEPLCRFHHRLGEVVPASVVDHVTPHKGDKELFFDEGNLQSLCKPCHDTVKQHIVYMVDITRVTSSSTIHYAHLYDRQRWRKMSRLQLKLNPLCKICTQQGQFSPATVTDHIIPHKGDEVLFFDTTNLQSLCKTCHDTLKAQIEAHGYHRAVGEDGWPIDINHPINRRK
jgi:5-methylcytosine-specific restriction protein A